MHEFAEEYVANLKPRDERYDTRLGDDFYVATFPNGVKTWVYVFKVNDYTRRQTLGIYPEMPLEQALESLYAARRTRSVEAELAEQGLDGTQVRETEDSPINLTAKLRVSKIKLQFVNRRFLAGTITGAVIGVSAAIAAWLFLAPVSVVEVPTQAATVTPVPVTVAPATVPANTVSVSAPTAAGPEQKIAVGSEAEPGKVAALDVVAAAAAAPVSADEAATDEAADDAADEEPAELSESQQALRQLQKDLAGTLAWAQLTSEVRDGEPVDRLSWVVELNHAPRRVFYFVRVRGMAGDTVTYRWLHQGKLLKEDSVQVGQGWHSPAYSGMTLTTERLGSWQVEVYGPDGGSLGSEEFEARMTKTLPQLSQR